MKGLKRFLIICILITVLLELTIFNINYYRTKFARLEQINYDKEQLNTLVSIDSKGYKELKLEDINKKIKSIYLEIENQNNVDYEIYYSDETTVGKYLGKKTYDTKVEKTKYTVVDLSRKS